MLVKHADLKTVEPVKKKTPAKQIQGYSFIFKVNLDTRLNLI